MRAMLFDGVGTKLRLADIARPEPARNSILVRVRACGVCRTDLHIVDGELAKPKLPLILGHQIVGIVEGRGPKASRFRVGDRVGVPWLAWVDERCRYCKSSRENLCDNARFTGYDVDGGYAEYAVADERFCIPLTIEMDDAHAAPLLCAGLIGYRALKLASGAQRIGFYGFGSSAHIIAQVAVAQGREVFAFTRPGDTATQTFARSLGAVWAGGSDEQPPQLLDAALIFAAAGELVPQALRATAKGGTVVCGGIHMSDIPTFPYEILWEERSIRSVANLTRKDAAEFFAIVARQPVKTEVRVFPLEKATDALDALRQGAVHGSIVLTI